MLTADEVITLGNFGKREIIKYLPDFVGGQYPDNPKLTYRSVKAVEASSARR